MAVIQSTKYVCDLCGQEFLNDGSHIAKESVPYNLSGEDFVHGDGRLVMHMDLCDSCAACLRAVVSKYFCKVVKDGQGAVLVTPKFETGLGATRITP